MVKAGSRKSLLCVFILIFGILAASPAVYAQVPYMTFTKDSYGQVVPTQPAYYPAGVIGKEIYVPDPNNAGQLQFSPLQNAQDIFIDGKDEIYIADTGKNRIVHFDARGKLIRTITNPESPLSGPKGVFVTPGGDIFIADTGKHRIVHLDRDGKWIGEFKKPESKFLAGLTSFDPIKVIVDKQGFIYVVILGDYRGLMKLNPNGGFESFFGANQTQLSFSDALKKMFYTREMYANELSKLPSAINNAAIDHNGFLYSVSGGEIDGGQVKKFNVRGKNMLGSKDAYSLNDSNSFGESLEGGRPQLTDLAVDRYGNIIVLDSASKFVSMYDQGGNLMFFWAGNHSDETTQLGLIKNPASVAINSRNELFILDDQENIVQKFRLTEFGALVNEANALTNDGRYVESEPYWRQILGLNSKYDLALLGLAKAAYKKEEYPEAMRLFKESGNQQGYSDAYWQIRLQWFQTHFATAVNVLIGSLIAWWLLKKAARRTKWFKQRKKRANGTFSLASQLKHIFYMIRHPIDGFTAIKFEGKGSYLSAVIILVLVYASLCFSRLYTSFTFDRTLSADIDFLSVFVQFFAVWFLWVIANYLVSSIYRGEGTWKNIFVSSAYCLIPFLLFTAPLAVVSNVMTFSESSIYSFVQQATVVWTILLFYWMVQTIHNYTVYESAANILWTLFAMIVFGVLLFITYGLSGDLKDFIVSVYKEVAIR